MTGRHEGPPLGSAARDATAPPYHGKRRAEGSVFDSPFGPNDPAAKIMAQLFPEPEPDDPPRCWSCGHPWDAGCECTCCGDNAPEGWGPDNV